ncbi:MAG: hypothetical protein ACTSXF_00025, partial [Promethearchaeota archaeon]
METILKNIDFQYVLIILALTLTYQYPIIVIMKQIKNEYKSGKNDRIFSYFLTIILLFTSFIMQLVIYFYIKWFRENDITMDLLFTFLPIAVLWGLIFISTLIYHTLMDKEKINRKLAAFTERIFDSSNRIKEDVRRKSTHIIFMGLFIGGTILALKIAMIVIPCWRKPAFFLEIWEYNPSNPTDTFFMMKLLNGEIYNYEIPWVHFLYMLIFTISGYCFLIFEAVRHSKVLYFPTNLLLVRFLRKEEVDSFASYFYFFVAMSVVSIFLPPLEVLAIVGVFALGDPAASQIGMRFGKRHILINKKKTWEGAIAGFLGSFIAVWIFLGPIYGILSALLVLFIDIFTEEVIHISDNLLAPIMLM